MTTKVKNQSASERLEAIRDELSTIVAEMQRMAAMPPTPAELRERVEQYVDRLGAQWNPEHRLVDMLNPEPPALASISFLPVDKRETEAAVAALFAPQLRAVLLAKVTNLLGTRETISTTERASRLGALSKRRHDLEHAEERLIREMESAGLDVDRRADISPEVLFAISDELACGG